MKGRKKKKAGRRETATMDKKQTEAARPVIWKGKDLAAATGGLWINGKEEEVQVSGVEYKLSETRPGDVFITTSPEKWGSKFAGNTHRIYKAARRGVVAVITDRVPESPPHHLPVLLVENTRQALDALGRYARRRFKGRVICVTGSVGKSTTVDMLRFVLGYQGLTSATDGNQNTVRGVPRCLANAPPDAAYGVFETSASTWMKRKALMANPHVAIITEIQPDHLDVYQTLEGVADNKTLLFDGLAPGGTAILNRDNLFFVRLLAAAEAKGVSHIVAFGFHQGADVRAVDSRMDATGSFVHALIHGNPLNYRLELPGRHVIMSSLAALAAVEAAGADVQIAAACLPAYIGLPQRSQRHRIQAVDGYFDLIDDAFSANPASIRAGLDLLGLVTPGPGGRRIVVLTEIKELGPTSADIHAGLADAVLDAKVDKLFTSGDDMLHLRAALPENLLGAHGNDGERLAKAVAHEVRDGDVVLVKGSLRAMEITIPIINALMAKAAR
jgi:UDP-N-acetylmuramoyl-tripeptide--D-alanyl-D-alanine ligase